MHIENIIIGKPLVDERILLSDLNNPNDNYMEVTVRDNERFLPKLLANHGFTSSAKEIRRNRPDLVKTLDKPDCLDIKLGKKRVYIVVGERIWVKYFLQVIYILITKI